MTQVFDICAAFMLAFFVVRGGMRGLTGEIVSLLGLVASVLSGLTFAHPMGTIVLRHFPTWNPIVTELACAVAIFIVVSLFFAVISRIMRFLVRMANLTVLDYALGAVAGAARAFIVVLFIYGVVSTFSSVVPSEWMESSIAMKGAAAVWPTVLRVMTDNGWITQVQIETLPDYMISTIM